MPRLHITLTQDQHDELKGLAKLTGKKMATLVHQAVSELLTDQTAQTRRAIRLAMRELDEQRALTAIEQMIEGQKGRKSKE
jgi:thymidine phosphorylase